MRRSLPGGRRSWIAAPARRVTTLVALSLASFLVVFDDSAVSVALPSLQRELSLSMSELEWLLNSYTLGLAAVLLLAGQLVDRFGARRALVGGLALFAVASVPAALTEGGAVLLAARAVQGVGAGFIAPASLAVISAAFPGSRRGVAIGVWSGVSAIGLGGGPLLGATIVEYAGWSGLFLLNVPLGVLLIAAALAGETATPTTAGKGRLDVAGAATAAAALLFALLALTRGNSDGWLSLPLLALGLAALLAVAAFIAIERRAADPVAPLEVLRSSGVAGASVVALLSTAAMCSLFFFISLYLQSVAGYSVLGAGAVFLPMTAVIALGAPLAGLAGRRLAPGWLIGPGMLLLAGAMLVLARLDDGLPLGGIVLGLTLAGVGVALTATPVTAVALAELPLARQGLAGALVTTARTVGLAVGVAVMGAIVGETGGAELTEKLALGLKLNAAIAAAGAIAGVWLLRSCPRTETQLEPEIVSPPGEAAAAGWARR